MPAKLLIFLTGVLFLQSPLRSQSLWSAGFSAGVSDTRIFDSHLKNFSTLGAWRPAAGIFSEVRFGRRSAVHLGLGYAMMTQMSEVFRNDFHYLSVPLYYKFGKIREGRRIGFRGLVGNQFQYLLSSRHVYSDGSSTGLDDYVQDFHMDLTLGGGLEYAPFPKVTIELLAMISLGTSVNHPHESGLYLLNLNKGIVVNLHYFPGR